MSSIEELKFDEKNFNKHTEFGMGLLEKSLRRHGAGRSILVDKDNKIIAGNGIAEVAGQIGLTKTRVVETTGDELVVVKRTDVTLDSPEGREMAFADNATASADLEWDEDTIKEELTEEQTDDWGVDVGWEEEEEPLFEDNERERTFSAYNLDLYRQAQTTGKWQIPMLKKETFIPTDLLGFNYMKSAKNKSATIHFFIDDYQFERIWTSPDKYIGMLAEFEGALTPDFSLYATMPLAMQLWNTYRSRLIGQSMQSAGIHVIPTVSWSTPESFEFCFDGIEQGSTIAISTVGSMRSPEAKALFLAGFNEAMKRLKPSAVVLYGNKIEVETNGAEVVWFQNEVTESMKGKNK